MAMIIKKRCHTRPRFREDKFQRVFRCRSFVFYIPDKRSNVFLEMTIFCYFALTTVLIDNVRIY